MSTPGVVQYHYFVNNCLGSFFRGTLNWFGDVFFPRINYKVIGTYEKSVEYFKKKKDTGGEIETNFLPSITLDPSYEFQPEERMGKLIWQYPHLSPGLGKKIFDSIEGLESQDINLTPVFTRYAGAFDLIFWLNSVYELFDFRLYLMQFCGGYNRYIRPTTFDSLIVVPDELVNYQIELPDGSYRSIDWSQTDLQQTLITNTATTNYTLPVLLSPMFKLVTLSDSSTKHGGDSICDYKLTATFEYEISIPTYMVLTPYMNISPYLNIQVACSYSRYGYAPTYNSTSGQFEQGGQLPPNHMYTSEDGVSTPTKPIDFKSRNIYVFTQQDEDSYSLNNPFFQIPNPLGPDLNATNLIVISYTGMLSHGDGWKLSDDSQTIYLNIEPREGEIVELFYYAP